MGLQEINTETEQDNLPGDERFMKGMRFLLTCSAEMKKCCKKYKKGKRCKKCPGR